MPDEPKNPTTPPESTPAPVPTPEQEPAGDVAALSREAATRRRQLRETEAERDALRTRVDGYDKAEIERRAAERMASPADVWLASSLDAMRDDDGQIDDAKVDAELSRIVEERPHWKKAKMPDLHQGAAIGASIEPPPPSFGEQLKKANRR